MSKSPVVGMAWWNTVKQMEGQARTMEAMAGQLGGMAGLEGDEDAEVRGLGVGMEDLGGLMDLMKGDAVKRCFGDATLEFTAKPKGFSTLYRQHPAAAK